MSVDTEQSKPSSAPVLDERAERLWWPFLGAILFIALVLRLVTAGSVTGITGPDCMRYHEAAVALLEGEGYTAPTSGPLYPAFLALVYAIFGVGNVLAVQIAQAVGWTMATGLVALLGRRLYGPGVGLLAGLATAIYPPFVQWSLFGGPSYYATENLFVPLLLMAAWLFVRKQQRTLTDEVLAGLVLGLACLTRPTPLLLPLVPIAWGLLRERGRAKQWGRTAAALALGMALVVGPWTARNYGQYGRLSPVAPASAGIVLLGGNNPYSRGNWVNPTATPEYLWLTQHPEPVELSQVQWAAAARYLKTRTPAEHLHAIYRKVFLFFAPSGDSYPFAYVFMLPLALLGLWRGRGDPRTRLLGMWTGYVLLTSIWLYSNQRLRYPVEPALLLAATAAAVHLSARARSRRQLVLGWGAWTLLQFALAIAWNALRGAVRVI